ncbi:MAG: hypothetical protein K1X66_02060 [Verrucomicrobiae bacterium]|nr:hypothetical protein [Verrucomicrobiae bacterium]
MQKILVVLQFWGGFFTEAVEKRAGAGLFKMGKSLERLMVQRLEFLHQSFGWMSIGVALLGLMGLALVYF